MLGKGPERHGDPAPRKRVALEPLILRIHGLERAHDFLSCPLGVGGNVGAQRQRRGLAHRRQIVCETVDELLPGKRVERQRAGSEQLLCLVRHVLLAIVRQQQERRMQVHVWRVPGEAWHTGQAFQADSAHNGEGREPAFKQLADGGGRQRRGQSEHAIVRRLAGLGILGHDEHHDRDDRLERNPARARVHAHDLHGHVNRLSTHPTRSQCVAQHREDERKRPARQQPLLQHLVMDARDGLAHHSRRLAFAALRPRVHQHQRGGDVGGHGGPAAPGQGRNEIRHPVGHERRRRHRGDRL